MSSAEIKVLKIDLVKWIEDLSDENMLGFLNGLRTIEEKNDGWKELSETQKNHIEEGVKDEETGKVISSETFWNNLRQR